MASDKELVEISGPITEWIAPEVAIGSFVTQEAFDRPDTAMSLLRSSSDSWQINEAYEGQAIADGLHSKCVPAEVAVSKGQKSIITIARFGSTALMPARDNSEGDVFIMFEDEADWRRCFPPSTNMLERADNLGRLAWLGFARAKNLSLAILAYQRDDKYVVARIRHLRNDQPQPEKS